MSERSPVFACGRFALTFTLTRPRIMGIVNVTPDSFSDGGQHATTAAAIAHARRLIEEGADILDIGGESTRPGAPAVSLDEERRRVLPVVEALADAAVPLSVDTCKPALMREAIAAGASMINDIYALQMPEALAAVADSNAGICLMHMQGAPADMQHAPHYDDVVREVMAFLMQRVAAAQEAGIAAQRIVVDPGFGFGKTLQHNLELLYVLPEFATLNAAGVLAGLSRKSMLGQITGRAVQDRLPASLAAALLAAQNGAQIVRVHDVAATKDALAVWTAAWDAVRALEDEIEDAVEDIVEDADDPRR